MAEISVNGTAHEILYYLLLYLMCKSHYCRKGNYLKLLVSDSLLKLLVSIKGC